MSDKNNVVNMPLNLDAKRRIMKNKFVESKKHFPIYLSILSLMLVTLFANKTITHRNIEVLGESRFLASVEPQIESEQFLEFEHSLAERFAQNQLRAISSKTPGVMDQLIYGDLRGLYSVKLQDGHITELELTSGQSPVVLTNLKAFITKYKNSFSSQVNDVVELQSSDKSENFKSYVLFSKNQTEIGRVSVLLDESHGLKKVSFVR